VARIYLSRAEAERGPLPCVCMQCGAPATDEVPRHHTTDRTPLPPDPILGGIVLFPLWLLIALIKLLSWSTAQTVTVRTPLCRHHAHGWFASNTIVAESISNETVVLDGVSEAFAQAHERRYGAARAA
jgi:hypothetical protein